MGHYLSLIPGTLGSALNQLHSKVWAKSILATVALGALVHPALALNPSRALSQYTRTVWTQDHGLPQDTVRAIAQTKDGYLWLGTDEGLAQFDGYDFVVFNKENGALPSNSVATLWAAKDGSLWIGTLGGLTRYRNGKFTTFTKKDGLGDTSVNSITEDKSGAIWVAAGVYVNRFQNGTFTKYSPREGLRTVYCGLRRKHLRDRLRRSGSSGRRSVRARAWAGRRYRYLAAAGPPRQSLAGRQLRTADAKPVWRFTALHGQGRVAR